MNPLERDIFLELFEVVFSINMFYENYIQILQNFYGFY